MPRKKKSEEDIKQIPDTLEQIPDTELYSPADLAPRLGVHVDTVRDMVAAEQIPSIKIGQRRFVSGYLLKMFLKGEYKPENSPENPQK